MVSSGVAALHLLAASQSSGRAPWNPGRVMKTTTIRHALAVALFLVGCLAARPAAAGSLTLQWDFNPEPEVTGYIVYVGTASGSYTQSFDVGNVDTFVFDAGLTGQRYYFAVAAYAGLLVSDLSVEVSGEATATSNAVPYIYSPGNQTSRVGQPVSLQIVGGDSAFEPVTYLARSLPNGLRIASNTGLITGTPTTAGNFNTVVTVSDGVLSSQAAFGWTVQTASGGAPPAGTQPPTGTQPPGDDPVSGGAVPRDEATVRALRTAGSTYTGTAAVVRPDSGGVALAPRDYTGTAALVRTTAAPGSTTTVTSSPRTFTGTSALTRDGVTTGATELSTRAYTGTAAVNRSLVDPGTSLDPLSYTGTSAIVRRTNDTTSSTGTLATPSRSSSARALSTSSSSDGTAAMTRSGAPSTVTASSSGPAVSIQTPVDQASFAIGAEVIFSAMAQDAEDGDLSSRIFWFSSLDGQIGSGGSTSRVLSPGAHIITATVTDKSGNMRSARVSVVVR